MPEHPPHDTLPRRPYRAPQLVVFGFVVELTASGSAIEGEASYEAGDIVCVTEPQNPKCHPPYRP